LKKLITTADWKRYLRNRQASSLESRRKHALYRLNKNRAKNGTPQVKSFRKWKTVDAPEVFSLIENANHSVAFLNSILNGCQNANVFVNLSAVRKITPEAIAVLLALIYRTRSALSMISGNLPTDPDCRQVINRSGFRDYVRTNDNYQQYDLLGKVRKRSGSVETIQAKYDQRVALELIEFAMDKLTGRRRSHGPSFAMYGELMLNTLNHASSTIGTREPWWASVYCDTDRKTACFTFIDQGVGIFGSHSLNLILQVSSSLRIKRRGDIMKMLLEGKIQSSTKGSREREWDTWDVQSLHRQTYTSAVHSVQQRYRECRIGSFRDFAGVVRWDNCILGGQCMTSGAVELRIVEFTNIPGPRKISEGEASGEEFLNSYLRPRFTEAIRNGSTLFVNLNGAAGFPTSFLEEAFGGLAREFGSNAVKARLVVSCEDEPYVEEEVLRYIRNATQDK
jgi:hypothetical protein